MRFIACLLLLSGATVLADEGTKAEKLNGTWVIDGSKGGGDATSWMFEAKGDVLKVTRMQGVNKTAEFECSTTGKDCKFKDAGKDAKVSMWHLGPKLVQLETKGNEVIKRRFLVSDQGDTMQVECISIAPDEKTETLTFRRVQTSAQKQ